MGYLKEHELGRYASIINGTSMGDVEIASELIDSYLGRSFAPKRYVERVRLIKGRRGKLQHAPVLSLDFVDSIEHTPFGSSKRKLEVGDIELDPENDGYFTFIGSGGINFMLYGTRPRLLEVGYVGGFEDYPEGLKTACGMLACNIRQALSFAGAKELTSLDFKIAMSDDSFFTSDIKRLLDSIR